jgi:hypothetical protein
MRRPVIYLAGFLLATGASLALAGPASAAPSNHCHKVHHADWYFNNDTHSYEYNQQNAQNDGSSYNGITLLSGISNNGSGGGLLGGLL